MVLRWNWKRKGDDEPITRIMIPHYLTRGDLTELLIIRHGPTIEDDLMELSKTRILRLIRLQLRLDPTARHHWRDLYEPEDDLTESEVWGWAVVQVAKLLPFGFRV